MKLSQIRMKDIELVKDGDFDILSQCTLKSSQRALSFLEDIRFINYINTNKSISCIICKPELVELVENEELGIICSTHPKLTFFQIHNNLVKMSNNEKNYSTEIGENCIISPLASIASKNVIIGDNVLIEENVVIRENVKIGNNSIIRAGSIIGGQGYELKRNGESSILRVNHVGKVLIEDFVEIKEFCSIHLAVFDWDYTKIDEYSKLDAHTHIGHATKLGKRVMVGSHCNLAGNINIGDDVYVGPGVTISNRLNISKKSRISIGSVVTKDVSIGEVVTGNFAIPHEIFINDLKEKIKKE